MSAVPLPSLLLALGSAALGALFVATDAAIGALSPAKLSALLEQEDLPYRNALLRFRESPNTIRAAYTVGRVLSAAVCAVVLADVVRTWVPGLGGIALAVFITVIVFAPLTDISMSLARRRADVWAPLFATLLRPLEVALLPLAWPLERLTTILTDQFPEPERPAAALASAEVEYLVDEVERQGVVGHEPAEMIRNVLEFEEVRVHEIMVPRTKAEAIELDMPLDMVRQLVAESGHSRYPLYRGQLDETVGILCAKDLFKLADNGAPRAVKLASLVRGKPVFVHEQQKLGGLLREMRQKRQHMAMVVDEFGGVSGLITLEDIIEVIVGDIRDEHDEAAPPPIVDLGDGRLHVDASLPTNDLLSFLGVVPDERPVGALHDLFDQGALVGDHFEQWETSFTVVEVEGRDITRIEVARQLRTSARPSGAASSHPTSGIVASQEESA